MKKKIEFNNEISKISIITQMLNGEKTLEKCLKVFFKYPKQKIEHIVIDSNSKYSLES